jgi:hypothetical protein
MDVYVSDLVFLDRVLLNFCLGWPQTLILLPLPPERLGLQFALFMHAVNEPRSY